MGVGDLHASPCGDPLTATRVFPPMVTRMISIGEKTGALEKLLMKISEFYDQEVRATVKALTSLIEPLLIATMGIIVGFIVLAIFMPIIALQRKLSGGTPEGGCGALGVDGLVLVGLLRALRIWRRRT